MELLRSCRTERLTDDEERAAEVRNARATDVTALLVHSVRRLGAPDMGVNWKGGSPFVWEHGCPVVLHGQQDGENTRARQLPDREVWWEGSLTQT